jgi:hypothetical protein
MTIYIWTIAHPLDSLVLIELLLLMCWPKVRFFSSHRTIVVDVLAKIVQRSVE